jgi:nitrite reductase/ring-hydroxylating ferredoxin subunit
VGDGRRCIVKVFLADDSDVREGDAREVEFFGRSAIVTRQGGRVKVYANVCTHMGGPLSLDGEVLRCAWHGACFEPGTGKAIGGPAPPDSRLMRLPFRIEDGGIFYVYGEERAA